MILAAHIVFTAYGFWLPNDPRGSWSDFVRRWELLRYGPATKTTERRSLAHDAHDRERRHAAKKALKYEPVRFTGIQARAIGRGFARAIEESLYAVLACAILPDHVHGVVECHERTFERIIGHLKTLATQQLLAENLHPFASFRDSDDKVPPVWVEHGWKVFLNSDEEVARAIQYVNGNPMKEGLKEQSWTFVRK